MPSQLRIYTINRGKMDDFVQAWLKGVYPLRLRYGFTIPSAWVVAERNAFVWILGYDGPESWEVREAIYYGSQDRAVLNPDPRQFIAHTEHWFISSVLPPSRQG